MENYNAAAARSFNGIRQLSSIPEFHNAPHTYRNGDINHTAEAYTQSSTGDDVLWNSSWAQFLALMKAPSAVSENGTANKTVNSANAHFIPSSFSQDEINLISSVTNTQTALSENGIPNKSVDAVNKHDIPNPRSQHGRNSMQSNIANPSLSNQKQYLASDQQCHGILPWILHDGFPVPLQLQYNWKSPAVTEADTASSITNSSQCAPETPKQTKKLENNHYSATMEVNGKSLAVSVGNEGTKHHCHELIQNIADASSATICTAVEAKNNSDKGVNQDFDLERTPPQKTPKRKKHRPKVVVAENKPQRNRKPMNPKNNDPKVEIFIKRKYVRKNVPKTTNTPEADAAKKTNNSSSEPTSRSCRKALNFNMENQKVDEIWCKLIDQQETRHTTRGNSFINANSKEKWPDAKCCSAAVGSGRQTVRWNEVEMSNKIAGLAYGPCQAVDQAQTEDIFISNGHTPKTESMLNYPQTEKSCVIPCNKRGRATDQCQNANYCSILANSHTHGKVGQSFFQERSNEDKLEQIVHRTTQKQLQKVYDSTEGRGSKREYCMTAEHGNPNALHLMNCLPASQEFLQINQHKSYGSGRDQSYPGIHKKKKVKNAHHTTMLIRSMQNCPMFAENVSRLVHTNNGNQILTNQVGKGNGGSFNPSTKTSENPNSGLSYKADEQHAHSTFAHIRKQNMSSEVCLKPERMEKWAHVSNPSHMISSMTSRVASDMLPRATSNNTTTCKDGRGTETLYRTSHSSLSNKQWNEEPTVPKTASQKTDSQEKQRNLVSINEIVWQFQYLNLNATGGEMVRHEQNALVRYKDGMIIPYEAFDPTKMRKPRPKVDLDPETNRIWKLLMGKEVSNDDKEMDKDKAKWWEEERKVFRGRADSFVARMRLVQGDRRFSQWKGSVVDSVIGVFLTQNVTDHLSSSAFMSLAARFPIQPCKSTTGQNHIPTTLIGEPEVFMLDTDNNNRCLEKSTNPTIYIRAPEKSSNHTTYNPPLANRTPSTVEANNWGMEEVISSQDSTESSIFQAARQSNSRAYCAPNGCKSINNYSSTSFTLQKMETVTRFTDLPCQLPGIPSVNGLSRNRCVHLDSTENSKYKQVGSGNNLNSSTTVSYPFDLNRPHIQVPIVHSNYSQFPITTDSGLLEVQSSKTFGNERVTFLPSSYLGVSNAQYVGVASGRIGQFTQSKTALQQNGGTWAQGTPTILYSLHNKQQTDQNNSTQAGVQAAHYQHSCRNYKHGGTMTFQLESRSHTEPVSSQICVMQSVQSVSDLGRPKYNFMNISVAGKEEPTVNRTARSNSTEQLRFSSEAHIRTNTNTLDKKVKKIEGEKKMAFDWDGLRKQVQSNGRKERTRDTKDSIDYEAIRCADVNEISTAIKDRGMNNMLADRIKDFLNRLVRDHGSMDLEWLRDVPPDKAKDYLLSIRGLGLKSVECVRLLALHQHAFPVDTNVGRIAVRLGWVPLQPLPESLQLHLLELYPVLESIQKYLWPRLCKLDQQTLYELHYQLITFGKVFCTKSKPNCNACPMRGECRHFASAFASSRLALPGPEESSIVTSADAISANRKPTINIHPIKLRPLEDRTSRESEFECRRSEPIVEEPTTPVQESTETSETDIEDAFCNDPDEIPIIKLTAENITVTSQNCSRGNVELREWDMSKALVALDPGTASIPATKLKNVNRLRTEHRVYELPESHPLLKKLDKREPDDPSPYLLAIWTPGETANSIQPPEGICRLWESGKLCSEKTCFSCNSKRESNSQIVRGTLLIPCRTAMRGSFPLNGTYFQVNEVFADHDSSLNPIDVPRECLWNLPRRTVYFGTSVSTIFKGMSTRDIQQCFWRGFVCVRGFDRKTRAPRPLMARLHFPASKLVKGKMDNT